MFSVFDGFIFLFVYARGLFPIYGFNKEEAVVMEGCTLLRLASGVVLVLGVVLGHFLKFFSRFHDYCFFVLLA